jgi:hypothetical protein
MYLFSGLAYKDWSMLASSWTCTFSGSHKSCFLSWWKPAAKCILWQHSEVRLQQWTFFCVHSKLIVYIDPLNDYNAARGLEMTPLKTSIFFFYVTHVVTEFLTLVISISIQQSFSLIFFLITIFYFVVEFMA